MAGQSKYDVVNNFINSVGNELDVEYGEPAHWLHIKLTKQNGVVNAEIRDSLNRNNQELIEDLSSIGINNVNVLPSAQQPNAFSCGDFTFANTLASKGIIGYDEVFDTAFNLRQQLDRTRNLTNVDYSEYQQQNRFNGQTLPITKQEPQEVINYLKSNDAKREIESKFKREIKRLEQQASNAISKTMRIYVHGGVTSEEVRTSLKKQRDKNKATGLIKGFFKGKNNDMSNRAEKADILSNHEQTCQDLALIANYHSGGNFNPEALDGIKHLIYLSTGNDTFNYDAAPINVIIEAIHHGAILTQNKINEEQRQLDEENRTSLVNDFNALHVSDAQYSFTKDSVKFLAALNQNCSNLSALLDMSEKSTPKAHKIIADRIDKGFNEGRF